MEYSKFFQIIRTLISWIGDMMNIEFIKGLPFWKIGVILFFISALFSILQLAMSGTVNALSGDLGEATIKAQKAVDKANADRKAREQSKKNYKNWQKEYKARQAGGDS